MIVVSPVIRILVTLVTTLPLVLMLILMLSFSAAIIVAFILKDALCERSRISTLILQEEVIACEFLLLVEL